MGGRHQPITWQHPLAPSELVGGLELPPSAEDAHPWALQRWDSRQRQWAFASLGMVPLRRKLIDLRQHARMLKIRSACRYVWVRHWTPDRQNGAVGWRACLDTKKTVGPVRP